MVWNHFQAILGIFYFSKVEFRFPPTHKPFLNMSEVSLKMTKRGTDPERTDPARETERFPGVGFLLREIKGNCVSNLYTSCTQYCLHAHNTVFKTLKKAVNTNTGECSMQSACFGCCFFGFFV